MLVKSVSPNSRLGLNCIKAFAVGGGICVLGQALYALYGYFGASLENASMYTAITLVAIAVILTGFGKFDDIVKFCGAGASVPITGFANAVAAPAIEFKKEGWILGMAAKMFIIAGPVIVYGTLASVIVGVIYFFFSR
ncbi:MAG: SpoVA/SpoVAEb family sporulation membrane protein [Defluviitaleaceae bacterium]|nr:SpoVA/SpoVAEb family sporulation membrane protein [Defluviitaleaceae bacterium]